MFFNKYGVDELPFSEISLARSDLKRLRFLASNTLRSNEKDILCQYGLACEIRDTNIPGGMPVPTGRIEITERGRSYLRYRDNEARRFWIPVAVSVLALLLSLASITIDAVQLISKLR